ncbi:hypothetical protein RB595_006364 [Gaeumannomyces hyphopodioides]
MTGSQQPFLYDQEKFNDARFPPATFDPKAVTRASWEVKPPPKPKPNGPLVTFNQHPDIHEIPNPRRRFRQLGPRTKNWIRRMRVFQLGLRAVELVAALGILALMILITNVDILVAMVMRITAGVVVIHCSYGIYHLQRPAGGRTPASSASYMLFASLSDICIMPIYTYGVMSVTSGRDSWTTLVASQELMRYFVPALYWTLVGGASLHFVSLAISAWLGIKFRQISLMPPDMNPLEPHLTSRVSAGRRRQHKRNKSSVATTASSSSLADSNRRSGLPVDEDLARPASMPFSHTRRGSEASQHSPRDSRINLPSRQYQITPGNSPRNSANSTQLRNMMAGGSQSPSPSRPVTAATSRHSYHQSMSYQPALQSQSPASTPSKKEDQQARGTYSEVPLDESAGGKQTRTAKFTEAWYTSDSLINRTQQRNQAVNNLVRAAASGGVNRPYSAVNQRRDLGRDDGVSDDDSEDEANYGTGSGSGSGLYDDASRRDPRSRATPSPMAPEDENDDDPGSSGRGPAPPRHQHPLRSNPTASVASLSTPATPPRAPALYGRANQRSTPSDELSAGGSQDIADLRMTSPPPPAGGDEVRGKKGGGSSTPGRSISKRLSWGAGRLTPRQRDSSIQPESAFSYSKPYGELRPATPPVMVATANVGRVASPGPPTAAAASSTTTPRQISSGTDFYDLGAAAGRFASRRNVSGKVVEEGRSRYALRD